MGQSFGERQDGKLSLQVLDVHGNPITEPVDVFMKNQTLSDAPAVRDLDVTTTRDITGLVYFRTAPTGLRWTRLPTTL